MGRNSGRVSAALTTVDWIRFMIEVGRNLDCMESSLSLLRPYRFDTT